MKSINIFNIKVHNFYKVLLLSFIFLVIIGKYIRFGVFDTLNFHPSADRILSIMNERIIVNEKNDNFKNVATLYKPLMYIGLNTFIQYEIFFSILFNMVVFCIYSKNKLIIEKSSIVQIIFIYLSIILLNAYVFGMGKEPAIFCFSLLIYWSLTSNISDNQKLIYSFSILFLMGLLLKKYYFLTLIQSFAFFIVFNNKKNFYIRDIVYILVLFSVLYIAIVLLLSRFSPELYKKIIDVGLDEYEQANSRIIPIFKTNNYLSLFLNYVCKVIRLLFPIELFRLGVKYIPYIICQLSVTIYIFKSIIDYDKNKFAEKISTCIFVSYILTSAAFEPDFGSWIRHEMAVYPLIFLTMKFYDFNIQNKKLRIFRIGE